MKYLSTLIGVILTGSSLQAQEIPFNHGMRLPADLEKLSEGFEAPSMIYAPFMFWFWDSPMDTKQVVEMAETMISQGINPGYVHPRRSMNASPGLPPDQWLGPEWFDGYQAVTEASRERGAYLGYVDEYWWPSLQAKGRVLEQHPDLHAWTLETEVLQVSGGHSVQFREASFAVAARMDEKARIRSSSLSIVGDGKVKEWTAPEGGKWKIYLFRKVPRRTVNYMDTRLGDAFINIALEPYAQHLGDELGKTVIADFVDTEGSYGERLVWSDTLESRYRTRYDRDIRLWMPLMLDYDVEGTYAKARWEWFDLVSDIYVENFNKVVDWHSKRGMYCVANFWEESLPAQTLRVGDHMKMQRKYTMPGQDALHSGVLLPHDFMEAVSVGEFEKRRVMSEMLGASQWHRFNPTMLKKAINCVTAWGISSTSPHAVYTNRNLRNNHWMPDWYVENPLFQYLHLWSDFARRSSYINSFGRKAAEVLLYTPLESVWVLTDSAHFDSRKELIRHPWSFPGVNEHARKANQIDRAYAKAMNDLSASRIDFLVADRHYIKEMDVSGGWMSYGEFSFKTLVLPPLVILEREVAERILQFAEEGGYVYSLGELPSASAEEGASDSLMIEMMNELKVQAGYRSCQGEPMITFATFHNHWMGWEYEMDTDAYGLMPHIRLNREGLGAPLEFISGEFDMLSQHRIIDGAHFFWLVNNSYRTEHPRVLLKDLEGKVSIWDCENGSVRSNPSKLTAEGMELDLEFDPLQAYWVVVDPVERLEPDKYIGTSDLVQEILLDGPWTIKFLSENQPDLEPLWDIPSSLSGEGYPSNLIDWALIPDLHERFTGFLDYYYSIELEQTGEQMILDLGKVHDMAEVWINGKSAGKRLWKPYRYDLASLVKEGTNTLRIRVGNQVDNYFANPVASGLLGPVKIQVIN
jgi:hypothetical protein